MSLPRSDPTRLLSFLLCCGGLLSVALLTLIDRGATRAYSSPWIHLFWFAQIAPLLALAVRALPSTRMIILPGRAWCVVAGVFSTGVLLSSLLSPHSGPSLLNALTPLAAVAAFFLIHDFAHRDQGSRIGLIIRSISLFSLVVLGVSLMHWSIQLVRSGAYRDFTTLLNHRNEFPLGHANYTAGLALLILPWFVFQAWQARSWPRAGWVIATVLALAMLFSSGSRGGLIGLGVLFLLAVLNARLDWRILVLLLLLGVTVTFALAYAHPRTRTLIFSSSASTSGPNLSNLQRSAMAEAGWQMGRDRPILGWGTGTTPLVYPRYRARLDGGVENAFQLHSLPVQLWADLGSVGIASALALLWLVAQSVRSYIGTRIQSSGRAYQARVTGSSSAERSVLPQATGVPSSLAPVGVAMLGGYSAFALTDYQLDVPIFALAIGSVTAFIARNGGSPVTKARQVIVAYAAIGALLVVGLLGQRDVTPELNVQALAVAPDPNRADEAIRLLEQSLALNPDQEIAHFNLGWLRIVSEPAVAEQHFLAAAGLVPDKGGVYFGLALARRNQDRADQMPAVIRALAMECLNDPAFLISPWWRQPDLAALRPATIVELHALASNAALRLAARNDPRSREADYVATLGEWLEGQSAPGEILRRAHTSERVSYFASRPAVPDWKNAPVRTYRRERTAYPILMRDLDLPPPVDVFEVQESSLATGELASLFPAKGWLPEPLLLQLLNEPITKIE